VTRFRKGGGKIALALLALLPVATSSLAARPASGCVPSDTTAARRTGSWSAPLTRQISLHAREVSLGEALDRLAASARLRLSYSREALPLDRRVCLAFDSVAVGDALTAVLAGAPVRLVIASADDGVLTPVVVEVATAERITVQLDRIVVTGSTDGGAERALPIALDVLDGRELGRRSANTLSQSLSASVPGFWVWEQSPLSLLAQYGSIRGASSFGTSYPKVYLDGIQLANPLLLTRLQPNAIERIELIRGPQGAALYGADAISGVANIVSRHDAAAEGARARFTGGLGLAGSSYASNPALQQDYGVALRTGTNTRSAGLTVDAGALGSYFPNIYSRSLSATAVARVVGSSSILTGTLRFFGMRAGTAPSPVLVAGLGTGAFPAARDSVASLGEYTAGITAKFFPSERWQHSLTAGVDGYVLDGVPDDRSPIPSATAAALNDARGAAARVTLRGTSVRTLSLGSRGNGTLSFSAEQSVLRERAVIDQLVPPGGHPPPEGSSAAVIRWRGNTGLITQLNTALFEQLFLTGGIRVERDEGASGTGRWATLPMLGAAWAHGRGPVSFKLRGAYGKGIRWPEIPARETLWEGLRPGSATTSLLPEKQAGIEGGIDVFVGHRFTLQLTRFDQTASGLIQRVTVPGDTSSAPGPGAPHIAFQLQNVGEIRNRGWEIQGSFRQGPWSLASAFTQVSSRVRKLATGYTGDLQPGDRMLEVPERTLSFTAGWVESRWQASLTAYRAMDWINYDRLAIAQAFAGTDHPPRDFVGAGLRTFWREYPGVTHLNASVTFNLRRRLGLTVLGNNLLNRQLGEPDNITVLPGRTLSFGVRTEF
jgi:outer membrane receptor protein involved in Fe transport